MLVEANEEIPQPRHWYVSSGYPSSQDRDWKLLQWKKICIHNPAVTVTDCVKMAINHHADQNACIHILKSSSTSNMLRLSFFIEQTLSCKFGRGQRGQVPPGLCSWHKRWEQKTLKFRGFPLNTDARWYSSRLYGLWQEPDPQLAKL